MLVRGQNHCCCKPPKQCEQEIPLNEYSRFSFDAKEKEDENFGVYFDNGTSSVELVGQGSYTVRVTDNPKNIFVRAHILELNAGAGGITIRRPDSDQSISLWWMGGTSYELRQGTTVLESITHTAASQDLKLELTTPRDATTDVLVYIDATLVHTEVGVAFVMPDVLHLGMVVEGPTPMGGEIRFGFFEVSPCLASTCEPYLPVECGTSARSTNLPKFWFAHIPYPSDRNFVDCATSFGQIVYEEDVYFQSVSDETRPVSYFSEGEWREWGSPCSYQPITISRTVYGVDTDLYPLPEGAYPVEYWGGCTLADELMPHSNNAGNSSNIGFGKWNLTLEFLTTGTEPSLVHEYRISVGMSYDNAWNMPYIQYRTGWTVFDPNVELGTIVIPLYENNTTFTGWQPTISLEPNGASKEITKELMGCGDETCTPPVTPQPGFAYFTWISFEDEDGGGWEYPTCLGISYNDTTGSWEWSGSSAQGHVHPTCGALPDNLSEFQVKIHCVELQEGETKQWVLDITTPGGTARLSQVDDPIYGYIFEGTSDYMCSGQTWDVVAQPVSIVDSDSAPAFGSCPQSPCNFLWLRGQATVGCNDSSYSQASFYLNRAAKGNPGSPPSEWTVPGVDPSSIYGSDVYFGTWPFGSGYTIYVWAVDGSTYAWKVSHSSGTNIAMSSGSITCTGGEFGLDYTSSPYDWFGLPGGDPFGVCPGLDDSANIDIVWS